MHKSGGIHEMFIENIFSSLQETTTEKNDLDRNELSNLNESSTGNQQQPSLANYFQNSNKNEFFFDIVPKLSNAEVDVSSTNLMLPEKSNVSAASLYFTENVENNESLTSICTFPATSNILSNEKELSKVCFIIIYLQTHYDSFNVNLLYKDCNVFIMFHSRKRKQK